MKRLLQLATISLALAVVFSAVDLGWEWTSVESSSEGDSYDRQAVGFLDGTFVWSAHEMHHHQAPGLILSAHAPQFQPAYSWGGLWDSWEIGCSVFLVIPSAALLGAAAWQVLRILPGEVAKDWRRLQRKLGKSNTDIARLSW